MAFRSPENVQRNELIRYQLQDNIRAPANVQEQLKKTYKFVVTDRSSFYDWYNAFFEVQFKLDLKANGGDIADAATTIINGSHSLIKHMVVKNSLWYLDLADSHEIRPAQATYNAGIHARQALTSDSKSVNVTIPLNRYSFFETLEGRLLPPMQLGIELELTPDAEVIYGATDTAQLVIDRFYRWVPRLEPKDALMTKFVSEYQKPVNGLISVNYISLLMFFEIVVISESHPALIK